MLSQTWRGLCAPSHTGQEGPRKAPWPVLRRPASPSRPPTRYPLQHWQIPTWRACGPQAVRGSSLGLWQLHSEAKHRAGSGAQDTGDSPESPATCSVGRYRRAARCAVARGLVNMRSGRRSAAPSSPTGAWQPPGLHSCVHERALTRPSREQPQRQGVRSGCSSQGNGGSRCGLCFHTV